MAWDAYVVCFFARAALEDLHQGDCGVECGRCTNKDMDRGPQWRPTYRNKESEVQK